MLSMLMNNLSNMNWDDARVYLAVARLRTISKAADELGIGVATVSRKIERLEKCLKVPLFTRHQTGYHLTTEGQNLFPVIEAMETAAYSVNTISNFDNEIQGSVKIATSDNIANLILIPALPKLLHENNRLSVEISTGFTTLNLHGHEADIAIRMVKPERGNVTIRKLGALGYGLYCSVEYYEQKADSLNNKHFSDHPFVTWSDTFHHFPAYQWTLKLLNGKRPIIMTSSLINQVSAVRSGIGLCVLPHFLAISENLICLDKELPLTQDIWIVIQNDVRVSKRVRIVADFLADTIQNNADFLSIGHK
jgi:DNA-binding transcriptional LysR family regulator